jgi:uncharacterized FlgJ-related protein
MARARNWHHSFRNVLLEYVRNATLSSKTNDITHIMKIAIQSEIFLKLLK